VQAAHVIAFVPDGDFIDRGVMFDLLEARVPPPALRASWVSCLSRRQKQTHSRRRVIHSYPDFNMQLAQQRAWFVETRLVQNAGFPASAFSPVGYGAASLVEPNETPDGHDDPDGRQRTRGWRLSSQITAL
jgi:hypothetical protein